MKTKLLSLIICLMNLNNYASSQEFNDFLRDSYQCQFNGDNLLSIRLHHLRLNHAEVAAFGQIFLGWGTFYREIIVTDENAAYDQVKTLRISMKEHFEGPDQLYIHTSIGRSPKVYPLSCTRH